MKKMKTNRQKAKLTLFQRGSLMLAFASVTTSALAALLVDSPPIITTAAKTAQATIDAGIKANHQAIKTAFEVDMTLMDKATSLALQDENNRITSAIAIWTKQKSLSDNIVAENQVNLHKKTAAVTQAIEQKNRVRKAEEDFGSQGQGHKVCVVTSERNRAATITEENAQSVPQRISNEIYGAPGAWGDPYKAKYDILSEHKANYCTADQARTGYCAKPGDNAGLNLQGSTLFTPTTIGSDIHDAQNSMINIMVGAPDRPVAKDFANTPSAVTYTAAKAHKDTLISPALYSLKAIQAEFVPVAGHQGNTVSPIKAIDDQVARYLGEGEEYKSWNKTLVSGSERGIMKELLQVKALDLYLTARQYKQNERQELLLAAILAAEQAHLDKAQSSSGTGGASTQAERYRAEAKRVSDAISIPVTRN